MESLGPQPHRDPTRWPRLIDELDLATILVVVHSWLGPRLSRAVTPDDVLQETLYMAWRDRDQHEWRGLSGFRAWLLGIARNRVHRLARDLSTLKRGGQDHTETFSAMIRSHQSASVSGMLPPGSTTPSQVAGHRERMRMMQDALASLPPKLEPVVRLRLFEEVPMRDVADQLGIGLSTAKERLLRGVQLYRRRLQALQSLSAGGQAAQ